MNRSLETYRYLSVLDAVASSTGAGSGRRDLPCRVVLSCPTPAFAVASLLCDDDNAARQGYRHASDVAALTSLPAGQQRCGTATARTQPRAAQRLTVGNIRRRKQRGSFPVVSGGRH
jgi:hypothetical protein